MVNLVHTETGELIAKNLPLDPDTLLTGDLVMMPNQEAFRIVQRAFIISDLGIIDQMLKASMDIACRPVDLEEPIQENGGKP